MKNFKRIILNIVLLTLCNCSETGLIGYYSAKKSDGSENKISYNTDNGIVLKTSKAKEIWVDMPRDCSGFKLSGLFTPITPPIPLFWFRSWSTAECHFFTIKTKPETNVRLIFGGKTYEPTKANDLYNYTKYTFPIRAKNLDSGTIVIEKDGEKIEVPLEYKYFKFWY
jgi:hypothetical protein